MENYHQLLQDALGGETLRDDRTGLGTVGVFERQARWDLNKGFPAVTTKPLYWHGVKEELLWFLKGETNIRSLVQKDVPIWNQDALRYNQEYVLDTGLMTQKEIDLARDDSRIRGIYKPAKELLDRFGERIKEDEEFAINAGDIGPVYGAQWRGANLFSRDQLKQLKFMFDAGELSMTGRGAEALSGSPEVFFNKQFEAPDQIAILEDMLRNNVASRRKIVSAWNPNQIEDMGLPACHLMYQVHISPESKKLTLRWTQRSCDTVLGVPFNIASYALLANMLAHTHGFELGELVGNFGDLHVYLPHILAAEEQLEREPLPLPQLEIKEKRDSILDYKPSDFKLVGYKDNHHGPLEHETFMFGGLF